MRMHPLPQKNKNKKSSNSETSLKIRIDLTINKAGSDTDEQLYGGSDNEDE